MPVVTSPRTFDGTWSLAPNHELTLSVRDTGRSNRTMSLKGSVVKAQADAIVVAVRQQEAEGGGVVQHLRLSGRWQADAQNRLNFLVQKADGSADRLVFQGGWELGKHHELVYRHPQTLIFQGAWDVTDANRLVYRLAQSRESAFEFSAALRTPSVRASEGRIVYEVGIGVSQTRLLRRRVALFGTWKLHRNFSVSFEVPYAAGRIGAMRFEGAVAPSRRDRITVALRTPSGEPLGLTVTFTHQLFRDAKVFLELRADADERAAIGGIQVRF